LSYIRYAFKKPDFFICDQKPHCETSWTIHFTTIMLTVVGAKGVGTVF